MKTAKSRRIPHVLLLIETSVAYGRGLVEGISRYALEHGPWSLEYEARGLEKLPPQWFRIGAATGSSPARLT